MGKQYPNFKNPIIAAQTFDFPFVADPYQGHAMPKGREFIGEKEYLSIEACIAEAKSMQKKIILNIGDSSTSGWDSNIVTQNRQRFSQGLSLLPAFFQYKTYSDYLRDLTGQECMVINAGVPAHTSLQGSRRLKLLLDRFRKEGIAVEWVTIYYGNNDSVWDHNRQDKEWVGQKYFRPLDKMLKLFKGNSSSVITRVMPEDYEIYMKEIVRACVDRQIKPILIEPITPIYWKPGTRVLNEDLERKVYPGSQRVYQLLDEGRKLWMHAIKQTSYSDLKRAALEEAREKDYVVPRIKTTHLMKLRNLAREISVPYIQIDVDRTENDIRYFIDYCHPIGDANQLMAQKIFEIVSGKVSEKEFFLKETHEDSNSLAEIGVVPELPVDHYTLY